MPVFALFIADALRMLIMSIKGFYGRHLLGKGLGNSVPPREVIHDSEWHAFDARKSREVLGMEYRSMQEAATFMIDAFKARGWLRKDWGVKL